MRSDAVFGQVAVIAMQMAVAMAVVLFACATVAEGQPPAAVHRASVNVQPYYLPRAYPYAAHPYGGWGWNSVRHASTAAEGYARGQAARIYALGHYNLSTAEARRSHAETFSREIDNRAKRIDHYYAMRERNRQERAALRRPRPTAEQLERLAAAGRPDPLSPSELDAATGAVFWPSLLQEDDYRLLRAELEVAFAQRAAHGDLASAAARRAKLAADQMLDQLRARVREVPQQDYIAARRFLESLAYAVDRPAS